MSRFTPLTKFTTTFDGDTIDVGLRRMSNEHMIVLAPHMAPVTDTESGVVRVAKMVGAAKPVLLACVTHLTGLVDDQGKPLGIADIVDELYFTKLLDVILGKLIEVSLLTDADAKKLLEAQRAAPSAEAPAGNS